MTIEEVNEMAEMTEKKHSDNNPVQWKTDFRGFFSHTHFALNGGKKYARRYSS